MKPVSECFQAVALHPLPSGTRVRVVIPTKDHPEVLGRALKSFEDVDPGCPFGLVVVDNGSAPAAAAANRALVEAAGGQVVYDPSPFNFSALNNRGARAAEADVLVFCNDDVEALEPGWLAAMSGQALVTGVGPVGAKLVYPDRRTLQHCGVVLLGQGPAHLLHQRPDEKRHQFGFTRLAVNVSAVTGACLAVAADRFWAVGGWDEAFPVAYNDVDLCLRLGAAGYRAVCRNDVTLVHHESVSRGLDSADPGRRARQAADLDRLTARHPHARGPDPFYSPWFDQTKADFRPRSVLK